MNDYGLMQFLSINQINLMADIYEAAECVIVWLGLAGTLAPTAIKLIDSTACGTPEEKSKLHPYLVEPNSPTILLNLFCWI